MDRTRREHLGRPCLLFRAGPAKGIKRGRQGIDRQGGDAGSGMIGGVAVLTRGEADGHGIWIDQDMLSAVAAAINGSPRGVKSRFTHPGLSADGLGTYLGRVRDAEVDGDVVRADLHLSSVAHESPDGDLAEYVMNLAEQDPEAFGLSISFVPDDGDMEQHRTDHQDESGEFLSPDERNHDNLPHVRLAALRAVDVVDEPAANPDGLFHRADTVAREAAELAAYSLGLTERRPNTGALNLDAGRVAAFVHRFMDEHNLQIVRKLKAEDLQMPKEHNQETDALREQFSRDERARLTELNQRFKDPAFAIEMFAAGKDLGAAEAIWNTRQVEKLSAEAETLRAEKARLEEQLATRAEQKAEPITVGFAGQPDSAGETDFDTECRRLVDGHQLSVSEARRRVALDHPQLYTDWVQECRARGRSKH